MDKKFNSTGEGQKQMFYTAGNVVLRKKLSEFIDERNKERILNPVSSMAFEWGDVVWIVGDKTKIQRLNESD
jgi:CPA2 family monovalent cation:H+ antiporter-2